MNHLNDFLDALRASIPEWVGDALCAQTDPDAFFPDKGESNKAAKQVCASCPVRAECLDHALTIGDRFGIWGGMPEQARRKMRGERAATAENTAESTAAEADTEQAGEVAA